MEITLNLSLMGHSARVIKPLDEATAVKTGNNDAFRWQGSFRSLLCGPSGHFRVRVLTERWQERKFLVKV